MLKYRIKDNAKSVNYKKIDFEPNDLSMSLDSKSISGVFNRNYQIKNNDIVAVKTVNNSSYTDTFITTKNISRIGYFVYKKELPIKTVTDYKLTEGEESYTIVNDSDEEFSYTPNLCEKITKRYVQLPNGKIIYEQYNNLVDSNIYNAYSISSYPDGEIRLSSGGYFDLENYGFFSDTDGLDSIKINIIAYVDNGCVTYNDIDYNFNENYEYDTDVDGNLKVDENGEPIKILYIYDDNEEKIKLEDYHEFLEPSLLTKFEIERPKDITVKYDEIIPAKLYFYVNYKNDKYTLKFRNGYWCADIKNDNGTTDEFRFDKYDYDSSFYDFFTNYTQYLTVTALTCDNKEVSYQLPILYEYRPCLQGDFLFIYAQENYIFSNESTISCEVENQDIMECGIYKDSEDKYYATYCGRRIYAANYGNVKESYKYTISQYIENDISTETSDENVKEFEVFFKNNDIIDIIDGSTTKTTIAYEIDEYGNENLWQIERSGIRIRAYKRGAIIDYGNGANSKVVKFHDGTKDTLIVKKYKLNVYRYTEVDGLVYKANISNSICADEFNEKAYYFPINAPKRIYDLSIVDIYGKLLVCKPKINISQNIKDYEPKEGENISQLELLNIPYNNINHEIVSSSDATLIVKNTTFGDVIAPTIFNSNQQNILNYGAFELFKKLNYISLPISFRTSIETNLMQEDLVNSEFFSDEKEKNINPIIDMEKDIYYPVIIDNDENFNDVYEIKFNIHLRTRNLENWKVNNNTKTSLEVSKDTFVDVNNDNWNVFDNYHQLNDEDYYTLKETIKKDEVFSSDLVHFFNFSEDDVFYQKTKIGRTFLRLSFYDSPDQNNQNLLHYSTIFLDESLLYKKYVNNIDNEIYKRYNKLNLEKTTYCNVNTEPVISSGKIDYSKDRLEAAFSVVNRYETETSSEGFYLYMFKEYGTKLRPSSIYMKVELNHAGEGKTVPLFMQTISDDGSLTCMANDLNSKEITKQLENKDLCDEFLKGLPLKKTLSSQYIRLEVKYDEKTHRYVYYLPFKYMDTTNNSNWGKNKIVFNLWELKIRNES